MTPSRTALAMQAFEKGSFELVASELASGRLDDDPRAQLRMASGVESVARTVVDLGELLVRFELVDRRAPAAALGRALLDQLEVPLAQLKTRASLQDRETAVLDPGAPPEPNAALEEIEDFLASRASPSASFLMSPFGASGRELRLVERNRHGYDIWWGGCFFAIPHGRSPQLAFHLIQALVGGRREILSRVRRWMRWVRPLRLARAILRRLLSRWRTPRSDAPGRPAVLRVPLLRLSATRTGLEMQQHIADQRRRAPRAL